MDQKTKVFLYAENLKKISKKSNSTVSKKIEE
jgi:hypothetical protein